MARQEKVFSMFGYTKLMDELKSRDDVSKIRITNLSDYSGVEIIIDWFEEVK